MELRELGWSEFFAEAAEKIRQPEWRPARVAVVSRGVVFVWDDEGEWPAVVPGRFRQSSRQGEIFPVTGDWVLVERVPREEKALIQYVLPRRTTISRSAPGGATEQQALVANVDVVFVAESAAHRLNLRRLERYLTAVWDGGASPVVLLTKADLCANLAKTIQEAESVCRSCAVAALSSITGEGVRQLRQWVKKGQTCALIGPSGVGKSTLINALCKDEVMETLPVREKDQKGRHTTTRRELVFLPNRALIIDTPGLRELQLWEGESGLLEAFPDVEELVSRCRFSDCGHDTEPGCAVRAALKSGALAEQRFASYVKLQGEIAEFARKSAARAGIEQKRSSKRRAKALRADAEDAEVE